MEFIKSTPIFNNETCPQGIKNEHATAKGICAKLVVLKGMLEFVYEDNGETFLVDTTKPFDIEEQRKHHVNLLWDVEFKVEFYKI